jgi:hypothetical protein
VAASEDGKDSEESKRVQDTLEQILNLQVGQARLKGKVEEASGTLEAAAEQVGASRVQRVYIFWQYIFQQTFFSEFCLRSALWLDVVSFSVSITPVPTTIAVILSCIHPLVTRLAVPIIR